MFDFREPFAPEYLYPPKAGERVQLGKNGPHGVITASGGDFAFVRFDGSNAEDVDLFIAWSRLRPEEETADGE